jgi:2-polyprenyl-6-methoxyphenol hydroxylase-like FAD-dependent oxidoreductase
MDHLDVLIVGAGPTGLTLACDLARRGIRHRLIEQHPRAQEGSRAFTLKPPSLEVFDHLGLVKRVLEKGRVQTHTRFYLGNRLLFDLEVPAAPATAERPYTNSLALPQWRTEALLRDRLRELGAEVDFGCRLLEFQADADGVTAVLCRGGARESVRAEYLVAADGGRSAVRGQLGLPFVGSTHEDARALLADVHVHGLAPSDAVHLWMTDAGHLFALRPTPHAETWQAVASLEPDDRGHWPEASLSCLQELVARRAGRPDLRVTDATWLSVWRYNLRMVDRYRVGRVLLAGDAAHVHSPFGGFGMNTGIQDAYNLGWKLALVSRGAADDSLLDTYEAERLPIARAVLGESHRRFSRLTAPRRLQPLLRFVLKPLFARQQRSDREERVHYRGGPLTVGANRAGRIRAGDSAPDGVVFAEPDGVRMRLFDLFRGSHFTALTFSAAQARAAQKSASELDVEVRVHLIDREDRIRRSYGATRDTLVLVRPDGYVGFISHRPHAHAIRDYLVRVGLGKRRAEAAGLRI